MARKPPKITASSKVERGTVDLDKQVVRDRSGRRITNATVDRLVAAAAQRRPGRPGLSATAGRSPAVSFRLTNELRRRAEREAAKQGKTVSQLAREALEARLG